MQKTTIAIFLLSLSMAVIVDGAIILLCPQISNIRLNNQPSSCDSAQCTTIKIREQPVSIDMLDNQRQYNSCGELMRSQLENLKKNRLTINNKLSDGRGINEMTAAYIEAREEHKVGSGVDQPRMKIMGNNQNVMNNLQQQLVTRTNLGRSAMKYLQNQHNTASNQQNYIAINTGAYNQQGHPNIPTAFQSHDNTLQSSKSQPISKLYPASGIKMTNKYDLQAIRAAFMQNHRNRVINSIRNRTNRINQQLINQGRQISQNNPSLIQKTTTQAPSRNYSYSGSRTEHNRRSIIQESSDNRRGRIDNLNLKYRPIRKKQIIPRSNKHQLLIGSNKNPFARFMGPSLSIAPGATPLNRPRPHHLNGFSNSMSLQM